MSGTSLGDLVEFERVPGYSEKFGKTQGNSVEFSGVLYGASNEFSGNSWQISWQRRVFRENLGFGVVSADLGPQKANLRKSPQESPCQIPATDAWICCAQLPYDPRKRGTQHEFLRNTKVSMSFQSLVGHNGQNFWKIVSKWES